MRKLIISIQLTVGFLIPLSLFMYAGAAQNAGTGAFEDFDFEDYLAIISAIAETQEHPHFLVENEYRYEAYQEENPDMPFDIVIALVNVNADKGFYEDVQPVADPNKISVLVNKNFELPSDWAPDDFTDIGAGHMMREEAAEQFILLREAMRETNLNINVIITYRSYATQQSHFRNGVARVGLASAEWGFARAGHSEHQTGLAIDILHKAHDGGLMMNMGFETSRQFNWLVENAHEFGFILRFPDGYRDFSGFAFEPWHWRYVGVPIATAMHSEEIVLYEEFYGRYLVQGVVDKVNSYILEQQALAEAAEAAAIEEAEAEAAAAEAAALAEEEAIAAAEAAALAEAEAAAAKAAAEAAEAEEAAAEEAEKLKMPSGNRHFLEGISVIGISIAVGVLYLVRKKNRV